RPRGARASCRPALRAAARGAELFRRTSESRSRLQFVKPQRPALGVVEPAAHLHEVRREGSTIEFARPRVDGDVDLVEIADLAHVARRDRLEVEKTGGHRRDVVDRAPRALVVDVREDPLADDEIEPLASAPARDVAVLVPVALARVAARVDRGVPNARLFLSEVRAPETGARAHVEDAPDGPAEPANHRDDPAGELRDLLGVVN